MSTATREALGGGRAWLAAAVVTILFLATSGLAGLLLAMADRVAWPFVAAYGVLVFGALVSSAAARRLGVARHDVMAAALVGIAAVPFFGYLTLVLWMWPAFAANRIDLGYDLRLAPSALLVTVVVIVATVALAISRAGARSPARPTPIGRGLLVTFGVVSTLALGLATVATLRARAQPAGYLGALDRIMADDAAGVPPRRIDDICLYREESRVVFLVHDGKDAARKPLGYLRDGDPDTIHLLRHPQGGVDPTIPRRIGEVIDGLERNVAYAFATPAASCPETGTARLDPGTVLLHDTRHHVWFSSHEPPSPYFSQLVGRRGYVTLRDVGAVAPNAILYVGWLAVALAGLVALAAWWRRKQDPTDPGTRGPLLLGTALVAAVASPVLAAAVAGLLW